MPPKPNDQLEEEEEDQEEVEEETAEEQDGDGGEDALLLQEDQAEQEEEQEAEIFRQRLEQLLADAGDRGAAGARRRGRRGRGAFNVRADRVDDLVRMFVQGRQAAHHQVPGGAARQQQPRGRGHVRRPREQLRGQVGGAKTVVPPPNFIGVDNRAFLKSAKLEINGDTKDQLTFESTAIDCSSDFVRLNYYQNIFFGYDSNAITLVRFAF